MGRKRGKVYLEDIPREEAQRRFLTALEKAGSLQPLPGESVPVAEGLRRVTAHPIRAKICSPHYHAAAMDGAAVRAEDTYGASETSPVKLVIGKQAEWVDTGDPLPAGYNAVVMIEHIQEAGKGAIEVGSPVAPWQHIRPVGEDIVATELVVPENHLLRPVDLGAVAAAGWSWIEVRRKPRVAIIPTGSELVLPGEDLQPGNIIEFNSLMLGGMVQEWGGVATRFLPVPDDYEMLKRALKEALASHDIVVVNAGSSAGGQDYTAPVIAELGEVLVHGIAIRPGHPVVLGIIEKKPVLGIPGYPVSAVLTFELMVQPLFYRLLGTAPAKRVTMEAVMTRKVLSPSGEEEFLRVKAGKVGDRIVVTPLQRGAGMIMSLVRADGLVRIPRFSEGVHSGDKVSVELLRHPEEVESTVVVMGSHDAAADLLANVLQRQYPGMRLSWANVGSMGGLVALKRGEAHVAGCHLWDETTGEYNVPQVRRLFSDQEMVIVNMLYREQGLIVAKGNPRQIAGLSDLMRPEVSFVNRQEGSGTRVLLDHRLREMRIAPGQIRGYQREEFSHLAIAAAVASGRADTGIGIQEAAKALDLDFVPLWKERFDLVMPRIYYESPLLHPLLSILRQPQFQAEVRALGGYDVRRMGEVIASLPDKT